MKIAIPTQNGQIDGQLGSAREFTVVTVADDGKTRTQEQLCAAGDGHISAVDFLASQQVDVLICGRLGLMPRSALEMLEITLVPGCAGSAEEAVQNYLAGVPQGDPSILSVKIEMDEGDPLQCMHDCTQCSSCCGGDAEVLAALKSLIPEVL